MVRRGLLVPLAALLSRCLIPVDDVEDTKTSTGGGGSSHATGGSTGNDSSVSGGTSGVGGGNSGSGGGASDAEPPATCGNGVLDSDEDCDEAASNGSEAGCCTAFCKFRPTTGVCRPSTDLCDPEERCSGADAVCPSDAIYCGVTPVELPRTALSVFETDSTTNSAQLSIDGDLDTRWSSDPDTLPRFITYQLDATYYVMGLSTDSNNWSPCAVLDVFVSGDGATWSLAASFAAGNPMPNNQASYFPMGKHGKFVKLVINAGGAGGNYCYIAELRVWAAP